MYKYGIKILETKQVDKLERLAEIQAEAIILNKKGLTIDDLSSNEFKARYSDWTCKDLKCLNKLMECNK